MKGLKAMNEAAENELELKELDKVSGGIMMPNRKEKNKHLLDLLKQAKHEQADQYRQPQEEAGETQPD